MRIIATGGTFDKHYDEIRGELTFKDSHLPGILKQARLTLPIVLEINQLIDSLHMQEANRRHILAACEAAPETYVFSAQNQSDGVTGTSWQHARRRPKPRSW